MAKFLVLWEMNPYSAPADPAERMALWGKMAEMTKKMMNEGQVKDWGMFAGGFTGYSIAEGTAVESLQRAMSFAPWVKFQVNPVVSLDEVMQTMQSMKP